MIVVPCGITAEMDESTKSEVMHYCESFITTLKDNGVRVKGDFRDNYSPGWKFYHWELKVNHNICPY